MKKLFAIIFTVCFVLSGCQKGQSPAPETNSVNESTISESFDDKSQLPATKQKEEMLRSTMGQFVIIVPILTQLRTLYVRMEIWQKN